MNSIEERNIRLRKSVLDWMEREERPQSWIARKTGLFVSLITQWLKQERELSNTQLERIEQFIST